jgi:thiosulfate/3-mercaptopyruvate sulfurtransferase
MSSKTKAITPLRLRPVAALGLLLMLLTVTPEISPHVADSTASNPWADSQAVKPEDLARELADKVVAPPTVLYVGFRSLFAGGHVPGASYHGTASTAEGLGELKKWADRLPRSANLVIYCGCCPLEKCPNIRPAFTALSSMGFKKLRVLILPTSFAADWAGKGYPIVKGM